MRRNVLHGERRQDFIDRCLTDVHQHVGIRGPLHCTNLIPQCLGDKTGQRLSAIVLQNLAVCHRRHPIVVEFQPPGMPIWFDESEVLSVVQVTGVHEYTVEHILPGLGPASRLVEEFVKVYFEREFEAIIELRGGVRIIGTNDLSRI